MHSDAQYAKVGVIAFCTLRMANISDKMKICFAGDDKVIYACSKCMFLFKRHGEICSCPDCGSVNIHPASEDEECEFERNQAEFRKQQNEKNPK